MKSIFKNLARASVLVSALICKSQSQVIDYPATTPVHFNNVAANVPASGNVWTGLAQSFTAQDANVKFGFYVGNFSGAPVNETLLFILYSGDGVFSTPLMQASGTANLAASATGLVQVDFSSISLTPGNQYSVVVSLPSQGLPPSGTYSDLGVVFNSLNNSYSGGRFYFVGSSYNESFFANNDLAFNVTPIGVINYPGTNASSPSNNVAANVPANGSVWTGLAQSFTTQYPHVKFGFYVANLTGAAVNEPLLFSLYAGDGVFSNLLLASSGTANLAASSSGLVQVDFSSISLTPGTQYSVVASLPSQGLPPSGTYSDLSLLYNSLSNSYPGGRFYFVGSSYNESSFANRDLAFEVTPTNAAPVSDSLGFVPVTPCRVVDTRAPASSLGGPTMLAGSIRSFPLPAGSCGLPATAAAYSLNVTVVPQNTLQYLSLWPTGQTQPVVSTLNSFDGRTVANAAIVPAGASGSVNVYVSDQTDVIIDVNGYFGPAEASGALTFVPVTPCRVEDTRNTNGPFGGPILSAGSSRSFSLTNSACGISSTAAAYSVNATVVPTTTLQYLTLYPTGSSLPYVSTLNSYNGQVVANAAIVPAGPAGSITAYATDQTNLITDINGYFTSTPSTPLVFNTLAPCRIVDTRRATGTFGGPILTSGSTRSFPLPASTCGVPSTAAAYALNVTAVPVSTLGYLTLWPDGQTQPTVSTLNSINGQVVANGALTPAGTAGAVDVFVTDQTHVLIDIVGYFSAP